MNLWTILLIVLVVALLMGGVAPWGGYSTPGHFYGGGYMGGGIGLVLVIILILVLVRGI